MYQVLGEDEPEEHEDYVYDDVNVIRCEGTCTEPEGDVREGKVRYLHRTDNNHEAADIASGMNGRYYRARKNVDGCSYQCQLDEGHGVLGHYAEPYMEYLMRFEADGYEEDEDEEVRELRSAADEAVHVSVIPLRIRLGYLRVERHHEIGDELIDMGVYLRSDASRGIHGNTKEEVHHHINTSVIDKTGTPGEEVPTSKGSHLTKQRLVMDEMVSALGEMTLAVNAVYYTYEEGKGEEEDDVGLQFVEGDDIEDVDNGEL